MILLVLFLLFNSVSSFNVTNILECNEKIIFILDSSSSINNSELYGKQFAFIKFKREINYIIDNNKNIKTENMALIKFDDYPTVVFDFNSTNRSIIKNKLEQ